MRADGRPSPRWRRLGWSGATLLAALATVVAGPAVGLTPRTSTPLWTERASPPVAMPAEAPAWVEIAEAVKSAVVNISTTRDPRPRARRPFRPGDPFYEFFERFFEMPERFLDIPPRPVRSLGSGFVINPDGYLVTNNHVVEGASEITVKLGDGREFPARIVGRDSKTDLALLKIDASGLPVVPLGDSSKLRPGEPVMAIGNPFGLEQTVTTGIVSATSRVIGGGPYDDFIQTDASINPGNSGGPLINLRGEAIGINTAIFTRSGGSIGIGFAIPINLAKPILTQLAETGAVTRGWLGLAIQQLTPPLAQAFELSDSDGAVVTSVVEGSPAMKAGLRAGDVIVEYDGRRLAGFSDLPRLVATTPVGKEVTLVIIRDGKRVTLTATIARLEEPAPVAMAGEDTQSSLGLAGQTLTPELARELGLQEEHGVVIRGVKNGSPAAKAGIRPGDVIVEVNRKRIANVQDMRRELEEQPEGVPTLMLVRRNGRSIYVAVTS
jgi:serine protease Do